MIAIKNASVFLRVLEFDDMLHNILQVKLWSMFLFQDMQLVLIYWGACYVYRSVQKRFFWSLQRNLLHIN